MEPETKDYFKVWGHYPFWDDPDPEGFNKRVLAEEVRLGMHKDFSNQEKNDALVYLPNVLTNNFI